MIKPVSTGIPSPPDKKNMTQKKTRENSARSKKERHTALLPVSIQPRSRSDREDLSRIPGQPVTGTHDRKASTARQYQIYKNRYCK